MFDRHLFNEQLLVCEDWEMWLRLCKEGYNFKYVPDITAIYHRIPAPKTISYDAAAAVKRYENVYQSWQKVVNLYPSNNPLIETYRGYLEQFHHACMEKLAKNAKLEHFAFEKFTKYLLSQFNCGNSINNIQDVF
jgi:hypothetical protein